MVSHSELGSDPPIESDRELECDRCLHFSSSNLIVERIERLLCYGSCQYVASLFIVSSNPYLIASSSILEISTTILKEKCLKISQTKSSQFH